MVDYGSYIILLQRFEVDQVSSWPQATMTAMRDRLTVLIVRANSPYRAISPSFSLKLTLLRLVCSQLDHDRLRKTSGKPNIVSVEFVPKHKSCQDYALRWLTVMNETKFEMAKFIVLALHQGASFSYVVEAHSMEHLLSASVSFFNYALL